jgi:type IV secretory pathway TrbL component
LSRINEIVDRLLYRFSRQSDSRRAAILGIVFGLLMCVIVLLLFLVFSFIATLGE